jgi:hypothetical protein
MSATIHKLPEPIYRPNFEGLFKVIDMRSGDNAYLIGPAELGIGLVTDFQARSRRNAGGMPEDHERAFPRMGCTRRISWRPARSRDRR